MPFAPVLTPYVDAAPMPRVEVFFEEFVSGTETVTVFRSTGGRESQVRGAIRARTGGTLTRIDFEVPFNVPVSYRAEMFDGDGLSLGFTDPATLGEVLEGLAPDEDVLPGASLLPGEVVVGAGLISRETWIHNPLDPRGGVRVELAASAAGSISRPVPGVVSRPLGRRVGVVLSEPRGGVRGLRFDVHATSLDTADKVQSLIGDYATTTVPTVCIRLGGDDARMRVPQPLFLSVFDVVESDIDVRWGGENLLLEIEGDEVAPAAPGLFIPLLTAADINAYFATAADVNTAHLRAVDVNRRYDLAGYAGQ